MTGEQLATKLLASPMAQWDTILSRNSDAVSEADDYLMATVEKAARASGYIAGRVGSGGLTRGHAEGVKRSNTFAAKVRRVLGFTYPKNDISF